jgi:ribosomal protein L37AE/L43A
MIFFVNKLEEAERPMNWIQRLMYGRYGNDQLNYALLGLYLVLYLVSLLLSSSLLSLIAVLCVVWAFYRTFSRKLEKRRAENAKFMSLVGPLIHRYNVNKCRRRDKEHRYFKCPNCGQQLRVPRGKGKISITCRNCGVSFEEKT